MRISDWSSDVCSSDLFVGKIALNGEERTVSGRGNGLISSVLAALRENCGIDLEVEDYSEHALGQGSDVQAAAYVECKTREGQKVLGVGMDADVATASVQAILSAANGQIGRALGRARVCPDG